MVFAELVAGDACVGAELRLQGRAGELREGLGALQAGAGGGHVRRVLQRLCDQGIELTVAIGPPPLLSGPICARGPVKRRLRGKRLRERSETVLRQLDLRGWEQKRAGELAGGLKQRLAMAVGLLHEPEILFLDEPTSGADPLARRAFWRRITALAQSGTTIVITTHFMEEAEYCDRMVIQDAGKILALGTPAEVRRQAGETDTQRLDMEQAFIGIVEKARAERKQ